MKRNLILGLFLVAVVGVMVYGSKRNLARGGMAVRKNLVAPNFSLKDLNGNTFQLSDLRGKAVVLNFWATWCPPCKMEVPWFVEFQKEYGSQGLQIVGVAMDQGDRDEVEEFARSMGINYEVVLGTAEVEDLYGGIEALPTTFYIGRDGKVFDYAPGLISHHEVERKIQAVLATSDGKTQTASE
jgi:thiol-disulfide isomerase/thioredoxin